MRASDVVARVPVCGLPKSGWGLVRLRACSICGILNSPSYVALAEGVGITSLRIGWEYSESWCCKTNLVRYLIDLKEATRLKRGAETKKEVPVIGPKSDPLPQ